jgi:hypothetical protein
MLIIMILVSISNMSTIAIWTMMVPFVSDHLHKDAAATGTLSTSVALGTLCGITIISLWAAKIQQRRFVMFGSLISSGILMSILGLTTDYYFALVLVFLSGVAGPFFGSFSSALYGILVPEASRGHVSAFPGRRFLAADRRICWRFFCSILWHTALVHRWRPAPCALFSARILHPSLKRIGWLGSHPVMHVSLCICTCCHLRCALNPQAAGNRRDI